MNESFLRITKDLAIGSIIAIVGIFCVIGIGVVIQIGLKASPVERTTVDSLTQVNDSIKLTIHNLDSIKNAKVIEVNSLDKDSVVKLFYELVSD